MQYVREVMLDDNDLPLDDDADLEELERTLLEEGHLSPRDSGSGVALATRHSNENWERTFDFDEDDEVRRL
jgi:hypothetical protein